MCGIAGLVSARPVELDLLRAMTGRISHRGPDGSGLWQDEEAGVHLGHRRLSIVDLSPSGHQPMVSVSGRYALTFNGEIYNHPALRREIEEAGGGPGASGRPWRGHSDTETLLEGVALWGLKRTLEKSVGMFALALWDRQERVLELARDRFGEKPLYIGWAGGDFLFGSELKALRAHPRFDSEIDRRALRLFASRSYVPAPMSIYRSMHKLEPGCILSIDVSSGVPTPQPLPDPGRSQGGMKLERYWSYRNVVAQGLERPIESEAEALEALEGALADSVKAQGVADVPVGAFLSGGIDSATVVALYQKYSAGKVRTFSIGFEDERFDEASHAKAVAAHFGTEHHEQYATPREAQEVIPLLPAMYDEPFGDPSQIPTYLVSRFARQNVTVALSGDGGDELFGGYNRYIRAARLWGRLKQVPRPLRSVGAGALGRVPAPMWNRMSGILPGGRKSPDFGTKVKKALRSMAGAQDLDDVFHHFLDEWPQGASPVLGTVADRAYAPFPLDVAPDAPDAVRMMYADALTYMPDDILCKVDRASMAVSLETRAPLLDHRVAEVAARIPIGMKIQGGKGKHILRELLFREAPRSLFDRPKAGFTMPVGEWIKGPLRDWAEGLLDRRRMNAGGYLDADMVQRRWQQHLSGEADGTAALWTLLMFQAWVEEADAGSASGRRALSA
jgi:asparagine synthase (glutamine-hydrolysing)